MKGTAKERIGASLKDARLARARSIAAAVVDPEIPVLTLEDLGVLRGVERCDGRIVVRLTPTYTGCPATLAIRQAVELALAEAGIVGARRRDILDLDAVHFDAPGHRRLVDDAEQAMIDLVALR